MRESQKGFAFDKDSEEQIAFEKEFPYEETPDQLRVTEEIKKDMESPKPMDRLLCGDVGYGKTEVAFRAIFKCILSGKQAALLCPTTILSDQHYKNALERFKSFPVDIAILNRFVSHKKVTETLDKLAKGRTSLIIAHRLSTIRNATKIIVITEKGIQEQGTHEELMKRNGLYKKLYELSRRTEILHQELN